MQQGSLTDSEGSIDDESASSSNLLESVQEQALQFSKLTQEIEEEKRAVKRQLDMENYSGDQQSYSGSETYKSDVYITHTEEYGEPEEETSVLIDDQGNQKTIKTRTVTKTVTEQKFHHVEQKLPSNNHTSSRSELSEPQYASVDRNNVRPPSERDALLNEDSSSDGQHSDRLSYAGGDNNGGDHSMMNHSAVSGTRYEDVRRATPEKFQPEGYGLEEDGRSESGDDADQYGLEAARAYPTNRGSSVASHSDDSQRYDENGDDVDEPDEMPIAAPRNKEPVGRAPLAMQESGSRASLDALGGDGWQVPNLPEVIKMLTYNVKVVQQNAAAYIQHLCFNNDPIKADVRELGGIPPLVRLLDHPELDVQLNACGALRNLSFGSNNDANKIEIKKCEGVPAVVRLVRSTDDPAIRAQATGTLWNLSAHPDLKGQLLELGLEPLVNMIIIPYAESVGRGGKASNVDMIDLFTNAVGVVRNLSSTASTESRKRIRECPELVRSLVNVLQANCETGMVHNKATENCICVLRNLTYRLQDETPNYQELYMLDKPNGEEPAESGFFCFGKTKPKTITPDYGDQLPESDEEAEGSALLWQPEVARTYCRLLAETQKNPEITEATLGAIQNLTSGVWKWAVFARAVIRKEKGLPAIIDRMRTDKDRVVRAGTIALTNLAEDGKNKELIGKFAMKDLVYKLPGGNDPNVHHSDTTVIAVLNTIRVLVEKNPDNVKHLRESAGIERITTINKKDNSPYQKRVVKAAGQVLTAIWQNKEVHSLLKKDGWNKNHFLPTVTIDTLPRRKANNAAGTSSPSGTGTVGRRRPPQSANNTIQRNADGGTHADSWV